MVKLHLGSLVRHQCARVCNQVRVSEKCNEITAVLLLLANMEVYGTVTTMDALVCQQTTDLAFRWPPPEEEGDYRAKATTRGKANGRLETRMLERTAAL